METKNVKELPEWAQQFIYKMRLHDDLQTPFEDYIARYLFVVVNDVVYCDESDDSVRRGVKQYKTAVEEGDKIKTVTLPHAIIKNGYIFKNRYGKTSF